MQFSYILRKFIFADGKILIILRGLIFAVARYVIFMPSMIIAGFPQNYQRYANWLNINNPWK